MSVLNQSQKNYPMLKYSLWIAQGLVAFVFCAAGVMELLMPIAELSNIMPWVADHPVWFTRTLGIVDIAGGIGIILPSLVRRAPQLIKYAAFGCASKQVVAIIFHLTLGEQYVVPLNIVLLLSSVFILLSCTLYRRTSVTGNC